MVNQNYKQLLPLKPLVNTFGGYSFMTEDEDNITIGVEIEYSNVPLAYQNFIQPGWSHPGDCSVQEIGENTYGGETTTPILYNNTDLESAMLNVIFLQAMGASTNASCGLHVHIGVKNMITPDVYKTKEEHIEERDLSYTNYQLEFIKQFLMVYKREEIKFAIIERAPNIYS
jgi:hypothetical protein